MMTWSLVANFLGHLRVEHVLQCLPKCEEIDGREEGHQGTRPGQKRDPSNIHGVSSVSRIKSKPNVAPGLQNDPAPSLLVWVNVPCSSASSRAAANVKRTARRMRFQTSVRTVALPVPG